MVLRRWRIWKKRFSEKSDNWWSIKLTKRLKINSWISLKRKRLIGYRNNKSRWYLLERNRSKSRRVKMTIKRKVINRINSRNSKIYTINKNRLKNKLSCKNKSMNKSNNKSLLSINMNRYRVKRVLLKNPNKNLINLMSRNRRKSISVNSQTCLKMILNNIILNILIFNNLKLIIFILV